MSTQDTDPLPPVLEPAKWYAITVRDVNPDCPNYEKVFDVPEAYSNGGTMHIVCGVCGQDMQLLTAVLLDPQPEVS